MDLSNHKVKLLIHFYIRVFSLGCSLQLCLSRGPILSSRRCQAVCVHVFSVALVGGLKEGMGSFRLDTFKSMAGFSKVAPSPAHVMGIRIDRWIDGRVGEWCDGWREGWMG